MSERYEMYKKHHPMIAHKHDGSVMPYLNTSIAFYRTLSLALSREETGGYVILLETFSTVFAVFTIHSAKIALQTRMDSTGTKTWIGKEKWKRNLHLLDDVHLNEIIKTSFAFI